MLPRIAMVSTFPPTQCGIATFAESLARALTHAGASVDMVDLPSGPATPPHDAVLHRHRGFQDLPVTARLLDSADRQALLFCKKARTMQGRARRTAIRFRM